MGETTNKAVDQLLEQDVVNDLLRLQHRCNLAHQLLGSLGPEHLKPRQIITQRIHKWHQQQGRLLARLGKLTGE